MEFWKYSGAGNDFVLFDGSKALSLAKSNLEKLCDRRHGIGADGVLIVTPQKQPDADFVMTYFNADGGEVEMCGNGARACVHWFCTTNKKNSVKFKTASGASYQGKIIDTSRAEVTMDECSEVGTIDLSDFFPETKSFYLNTGVPHAVFLLNENQDLENEKWMQQAPSVRHDKRFTKGCNVNFVKIKSDQVVSLRTFERGVEGETLACGTGAMAVARFLQKLYSWSKIEINVAGGILEAREDENHWWLAGPIDQVFKGSIDDAKI